MLFTYLRTKKNMHNKDVLGVIKEIVEKKRYSELRKSIPLITERTLSLQLKEMEDHGLIKRTVYTNKPPLKVEYELTAFGQTLILLLKTIAQWGQKTATLDENITHIPYENIDCGVLDG